ncbi:MAG: PTS sugar transporter subunit IIA, partial [Deltaproteobacteria bacterium]|nr:PTS sugar transporter subunit IIA [Deltaproteobacteria bacterium]
IGILAPVLLILEMGAMPILFSLGLIFAALIWYRYYVKDRIERNGAIYNVFERLGRRSCEGLDSELRAILKEKGLRKEDPFDEIVTKSMIIDLKERSEFEDIVKDVSRLLSDKLPFTTTEIATQILEGTRIGATPVTRGVALPHFRSEGITAPVMLLVRSKEGVAIKAYNPLTAQEEDARTVNAIFFLVSPEDNPAQHLRILAQIAERVDDENFMKEWFSAKNEQELKEALLRNERFLSLVVREDDMTGQLVNKSVRDISLPEGSLIAMINRDDNIIIPKGDTILDNRDRLTIIGDPKSIDLIRRRFSEG